MGWEDGRLLLPCISMLCPWEALHMILSNIHCRILAYPQAQWCPYDLCLLRSYRQSMSQGTTESLG